MLLTTVRTVPHVLARAFITPGTSVNSSMRDTPRVISKSQGPWHLSVYLCIYFIYLFIDWFIYHRSVLEQVKSAYMNSTELDLTQLSTAQLRSTPLNSAQTPLGSTQTNLTGPKNFN